MTEDSDSEKLRRQEYYRNFYTDLNDMRIVMGLPPKKYHIDLLEDEVFSRTIFVKIHNQTYSILFEELNQVFSRFGILDDVVIFSHGHGFHSKICFSSKESMIRAFELLNSRNIYDNCCTLELFLVQDFVVEPMTAEIPPQKELHEFESPPQKQQEESSRHIEERQGTSMPVDATWSHDVPKSAYSPIDFEAAYVEEREPTPIGLEVDETNLEGFAEVDSCGLVENRIQEANDRSSSMGVNSTRQITSESRRQLEDPQRIQFLQNKQSPISSLKVYSISSLETMAYQIESEEMSEWVVDVVEPIEIGLVDMKCSSTAMEIMLGAHQVFEKMSEKKMADFDDLVDLLSTFGDDFNSIDSPSLFTFDPGGVLAFFNGSKLRSSAIEATIEGAILERIWQWHWDPGGLV